jgi:threonine/homoserine/homoserine lactone efflux protein
LPRIDIDPLIEEDFPMTQLLLLFIAAAGILTITPGVDTAMVLRTSAADGPRGGGAASLGICLGLLAWGMGAAFSLLLAGIHVLLTLLWFSLLIALTVPLGRFLSKPRVVRNLDRLTGCVFLGFGLKLALAKRT